MKIFFFTASITRSHSQSLVLNWLLLALSSLALIGSIESTALISPQETLSELWKVSSELSFPWMRTTGSAFFLVRTTVCVLRVWWNHSTQAQRSFIFSRPGTKFASLEYRDPLEEVSIRRNSIVVRSFCLVPLVYFVKMTPVIEF